MNAARRTATLAMTTVLLLGLAAASSAHVTSTSYLSVELGGGRLHAEWEIAVRDIETVLRTAGFPGDTPIPIEALSEYARPRLVLRVDGRELRDVTVQSSLSARDGVPYCVLDVDAPAPGAPGEMEIDYRLFLLDDDPKHRALFSVTAAGATQTGVIERGQHVRQLRLRETSLRRAFSEFADEGVWHIWTGYDHIAFLLALLLPSVLRRDGRGWAAAESGRRVIVEVMRVVTAFTVAHSITLALATLRIVELPGSIVEPAIAASVLWAAVENLRPAAWIGGWRAAFAFGLLHGFGFAGALRELPLTAGHLGWGLLAFNLGVELGQLAIVAAFVPVAFLLRERVWYERVVLRLGSAAIAALAVVWLGQRLTGS